MYPDRHCRQPNYRLAPPALAALALLCGACSNPGTARAQTSANLTLQSEYSARGVALDTRPTLQLRVVHDTADGWYAGGFASPVRLDDRSQAQLVAYGGRAQRLSSTLTVDAGISRSVFSRAGTFDYTELYAGVVLAGASARLLYSPHYYGEGRTVYLDLNTAYPLGEKVSLSLHAGLLHPFDEHGEAARNAGDVRVALATDVGDYRLQVGWQRKWHPYLQGVAPVARALTASASRYF